jgi:hypothetical protein
MIRSSTAERALSVRPRGVRATIIVVVCATSGCVPLVGTPMDGAFSDGGVSDVPRGPTTDVPSGPDTSYVMECNVHTQDCTEGRGCYPQQMGAFCLQRTADASLGQLCSHEADCPRGQTCSGSGMVPTPMPGFRCRQICDFSFRLPGEFTRCPEFSSSCYQLTGAPPSYGVCIVR